MNMAPFTTFLIATSLIGSLLAQPITYTLVPTSSIPSQPACSNDRNRSCRVAIEELGALVQLLKELSSDDSSGARLSEDVIVRLVNALIYVATYTCKGTGFTPTPFEILNGGVSGVSAGGAPETGTTPSADSGTETTTAAAGTGVVTETTDTESSAS